MSKPPKIPPSPNEVDPKSLGRQGLLLTTQTHGEADYPTEYVEQIRRERTHVLNPDSMQLVPYDPQMSITMNVTWLIWRELSGDGTITYKARSCDGSGFGNPDAWYVIQNCINLLDPNVGGLIFIREGIYTLSQKLTVLVNGCTIEGAGIQTRLDYAGTDAAIELGNDVTSFFYDNVWNLRVNLTNTTAQAVGLRIKGNTYYGDIYRFRASGSVNFSVGIEFQANTTFNSGFNIFDPFLTGLKIGILADGAVATTACNVFGGFINGQSVGVGGSAGFSLTPSAGSDFRVYGTSINGHTTGVNEGANMNVSNYYGLRIEGCTNGYTLAGTNTRVKGGSIAGATTPFTSVSATCKFEDVNGINPLGAASIAAGGSPFTYTNSDNMREDVYLDGARGAAGTLTVTKNGVTLYSITNSEHFHLDVELDVAESIIVTYTSGAGDTLTMNKDRK